ncbi:hypothetical protein JOC70_003065 [Clostridium pascui]|uniref:PdaC/SigV domain-containing protein n=1 Tax=Clostridium pascui TaxID=46609 RepID=UPI00195694B5|nr:DUF4163 domain-containing protein [Clostridium pascui]MBM7871565.1 hypothetical protein [Clostridium pascui]
MKKILCLGLICILELGNGSYALAEENPTAIQFNDKNTPTDVKTNITVKTKEIKYKNDAIDVNIKIPVVDGIQDKSIQKKINDMLEEEITAFKLDLEETSQLALKDSKENEWAMLPYAAFVDYKVHATQNNLLSISVIYYQYTGGAHGSTLQNNFNIDLDTGNEATLKDFFYEGENYKEIISKEIKKQMASKEAGYFEDALNTVNFISNTQSFYVKDNNIVVCYGHYEIAPYAAGIQEFKIPFSSFEKGVKKDIDVEYPQVKVKEKIIRNTTSDLRIPIVHGLRDTNLQSKLNISFEKDIMKFSDKIEKITREREKESTKNDTGLYAYTHFNENYNDNNLLSISVNYHEYTGGARENYEKITKNININTGEEITLKDLFKDDSNYKDVINKEIKTQIQDAAQQMKKDIEQNGGIYKDDYANHKNFKGISDTQSFYIAPGNIVVYFPLCEIGTYDEGIPEFKIPISKIMDNIKTEFLEI